MAIVRVPDRFVTRRGLAATAASLNEVLLDGEFFLEKDTRRIKQGDGVTAYNSLPYAVAGPFDVTGLADGDTWVWDSGAGMFAPGTPEIDVNDLVGFPGGTTDYLRADGTFSDPTSGGGGAAAAGYAAMRIKAGGFRAIQDFGGFPTAVTATSNRIYAQPFTVDRAVTLASLSYEVTTTVGGGKARLGIYGNAIAGGLNQPGALLVETGDLVTNSLGQKTGAAVVALSPGVIYWAAFLSSAGVGTRCYDYAMFPVQWFGRPTTTANQPNNHLGYAVSAGWTAMPATWAGAYAVASNDVPAVFLVE